MGTIGSGEFNNRRLLAFQPSFSFQGISERESNPVILGREYLNRTNCSVDIFASEQNNSNLSVNWNVYYPYRGSFNREDPST